jgi:hypothetical protein
MPGTTSLGIRYPLQNETVTATSWQDLATDVDTLMTQLDALRDKTTNPLSASISGPFSAPATSLATTTDGTYNVFNTVNWDTGGFANLGLNPDRLTLPTGIYFARASVAITAYTTLSFMRVGVLTNTTDWSRQTTSTVSGTPILTASASGLVVVTVPSTALKVHLRWVGTGGPANFIQGRLDAYKIRDISDV